MSTRPIPTFISDEMQSLPAQHFCSQSHWGRGTVQLKEALNRVDGSYKEFLGHVYIHISSAAAKGEQEVSFEEEVTISNKTEATVYFAALKSFENLGVTFTPPIFPKGAHSQICRLINQQEAPQKLTLTALWKIDNPYFAPKILSPFKKGSFLPPACLNEDRKTGKMTDCSILLGSEEFPVHSLLVKPFCPRFRKLLENHLRMGTKTPCSIPFSVELQGLNREELDQLVGWMYGQTFHLHPLGVSKSLQLLKWSFLIDSDSLTKHCLTYLLKDPHQHSNEERLTLLVLLSKPPSLEMQRIVKDLFERRPAFYSTLLECQPIDPKHLLMLFDLVDHPQLGQLKKDLETVWNKMTVEQKVSFAAEVIVDDQYTLQKVIKERSQTFFANLPSDKRGIDEKDLEKFYEVYSDLTKEILEHIGIFLSSSSPLSRSADAASPLDSSPLRSAADAAVV